MRVVGGPRVGAITTVIGPLRTYLGHPDVRDVLRGDFVHTIDLISDTPGMGVCAKPSWLRPFYDGNEKALDVEAWIANLCKTKESA